MGFNSGFKGLNIQVAPHLKFSVLVVTTSQFILCWETRVIAFL